MSGPDVCRMQCCQIGGVCTRTICTGARSLEDGGPRTEARMGTLTPEAAQ